MKHKIELFNKEQHQKNMAKPVVALIEYFQKKKVEVTLYDTLTGMENIVISSPEKTIRLSHHSFYGYSRMSQITQGKKDKEHEVHKIPVTDTMWIEMIKKIIEIRLENE